MEIKPLYFDRGTNEITEAKPGDTLALPVTAVVEEYVTLFQNTEVNTCCALIEYTAIPVSSNNLPLFNYRKDPYVDCIILETGLAGQRVRAALTHGKNYLTPTAITLSTDDILYLGQDGKITLTKPSLLNGDRWQVQIGRLVNANEFIFDPLTPIDFTGGVGTGGNLPPIAGNPDTWLFNDGTNVLWKKITASDIAPEFAITNFSCSVNAVELGNTLSSPTFGAAYNSTLSSARLKDSTYNSYVSLSAPYTSFSSPGSFTSNISASVIFTLEVHNIEGTIKTTTTSIAWMPRKFWGTGPAESQIADLQNNALSNSRSQTLTVTANANEYIYLAIPSSFGTPSFMVGGFDGGFQKISTIDYTNPYAVTLSYDIWRSDNHSLGITTVGVT